jgi:hypothetical protein
MRFTSIYVAILSFATIAYQVDALPVDSQSHVAVALSGFGKPNTVEISIV